MTHWDANQLKEYRETNLGAYAAGCLAAAFIAISQMVNIQQLSPMLRMAIDMFVLCIPFFTTVILEQCSLKPTRYLNEICFLIGLCSFFIGLVSLFLHFSEFVAAVFGAATAIVLVLKFTLQKPTAIALMLKSVLQKLSSFGT